MSDLKSGGSSTTSANTIAPTIRSETPQPVEASMQEEQAVLKMDVDVEKGVAEEQAGVPPDVYDRFSQKRKHAIVGIVAFCALLSREFGECCAACWACC